MAIESTKLKPLLTVENLKVNFYLREGIVHALDGVNFRVDRGQTLGIAGESGCGKSVTSDAILQLIAPPGKIVSGRITMNRFEKEQNISDTVDITQCKPNSKAMRSIRGAEIAKIFQEPMSALSPVHTIGNQISEVIVLHQRVDKKQARQHAIDMLSQVGIPKAAERYDRYPFELSGGMRQRAMIAMALVCHPSLLIADEPTTALDVTTEAQILDLMRDLQQRLGMAILFISHNLGVIAEMANVVMVMYLGRDVESAPVDAIFYAPAHPYTRDLLRSIPQIDGEIGERLTTITGNVPDPFHAPKGCPYHPRCRQAIRGKCDADPPVPVFQVDPDHYVRCWLYE